MNFQPTAVALEPRPDLAVLVVRGVVLDEDSSTPPVAQSELLQERKVGGSVEDTLLHVAELDTVDLYGSQDLDALALPSDRDFGGVADRTPRRMERGVLAEACFVREDERAVLGACFFFRFGKVLLCHRSCFTGSARTRTRRGLWTENPIWRSSFRTCPGWYLTPNSSSMTRAIMGEVQIPLSNP